MRGLFSLMILGFCSIAIANDRYHAFQDEHLSQGRVIWLDSCEGCHGWGVADAPIPMHPEEWKPRLEKPIDTLYKHAINGFFGEDDSMMPARGGNPKLSDFEVKSAVDYMANLALFHIHKSQ